MRRVCWRRIFLCGLLSPFEDRSNKRAWSTGFMHVTKRPKKEQAREADRTIGSDCPLSGLISAVSVSAIPD